MKSSEVTPLSTLKFGELVKEAGFPAVSHTVVYNHTHKKKTKHVFFYFNRVLSISLLVMVIPLVATCLVTPRSARWPSPVPPSPVVRLWNPVPHPT